MNTGRLGAFVTAHKKELMIGGAGVAVLFGLRARSQGGASSTGEAAAGSSAPMPSYAGAGYDSSSSDVYNALQPQIEQTQTQIGTTQNLITKLIDQLTGTPLKIAPEFPNQQVVPKVPTMGLTPGTPLPKFDHYSRGTGGQIYGISEHGNASWLTPSLYRALGSPAWVGKSVVPSKVVPVKVAPKASAPPRAVPPKAPAKPAQRVYVVRKGDSLSSIAARLGIAGGASSGWQSLYASNRTVIGGNAKLIKAGQRLVY